MKQILFFTEAGKKIGLGHLSRCMALSQAFEEMGYNTRFFINMVDEIEITPQLEYITCNWAEENIFNTLSLQEDIFIFDSYLVDFNYLFSKISPVKNKVFIADSQMNFYSQGIVIIGSVFANSLKLKYKSENTFLKGPKYLMLRKEFWDVPEFYVKNDIQNILISLGSNDVHNITPQLIEDLLNHKNYNIKVVGSTSILKQKSVILHNYVEAKEMTDLMLHADLLICNGGQTLLEAARIGLPSICIGIVENQRKNIEWWNRKGFAKIAGWYNKKHEINRNTIKFINELSRVNERNKIKKTGRGVIDGQGARRCASMIQSLLDNKVKDTLLIN